jgi:putative lipoprotein
MGKARRLARTLVAVGLGACASGGTGETPDRGVAQHTETYRCADGRRLETLVTGRNTLRLFPPGRNAIKMTRVRAASGVRYRGGRAAFWQKGDTARYTPPSGEGVDCRRRDTRASWAEAAARGAAFRAIGQEPGWLVTVTDGRLRAELAYGQRTLATDVTSRKSAEGAKVWIGRAGDDRVRLTARRARCRDPMSGHAFPLTVRVDVAGRRYRGCGRWLVPR